MSARELADWSLFWRQEGGFGEDKADYRAGMIASTVANVGGAKKQGGGQFQPSDFMPFKKQKTGSVLGFLKDAFGERVRPKNAGRS